MKATRARLQALQTAAKIFPPGAPDQMVVEEMAKEMEAALPSPLKFKNSLLTLTPRTLTVVFDREVLDEDRETFRRLMQWTYP